jgi:hypothetical protein
MPSQLSVEVDEQIIKYLGGELDLEQLQEWFVPMFLSLPEPESASEAARNLELLLGEYSGGHLSEEALKAELRPLVQTRRVDVGMGGRLQTGSSSVIRRILLPSEGHIPAIRWG